MDWPKITKETPLEEIKAIHQRIWDYAIEHGKKPRVPYTFDCVACEYAIFFRRSCLDCPIIWPGGYCVIVGSRDGIFSRWLRENDPEKKTDLARQIRDLPFKYELES